MDQEATGSGRPAKSRRRPRKSLNDEPQEDKRARGRQAQRTYMQRKQAETDRLRKRIASLEDAVEGMSDEFLKFGERVVDTQLPHQPKALDDLKRTTEKFLRIARVAEAVAADDEAGEFVVEIAEDSKLSGAGPLSQDRRRTLSIEMGPQMPSGLSTLFPPSLSVLPHTNTPSNLGRFSPRLGYGLLSGSPIQNAALSSLWTHYVIAGPNSLAMRLYIDTLSLITQVLKGEVHHPGFIPSVGRFRFKYETPTEFVELATGQLARMTIGDSQVEMGANPTQDPGADSCLVLFGPSHPIMTALLRAQIHSEVNYAMGSMAEWLDPWNAQVYLGSRWGLHCSYSTAQITPQAIASVPRSANVVIGSDGLDQSSASYVDFQQRNARETWDTTSQVQDMDVSGFFEDFKVSGEARVTSDLVLNVQPLAKKLIQESVCFGEGPRFFKENIDGAVKEFLGQGAVGKGAIPRF